MPTVFIQIDENPNCEPVTGLVFQPRTEPVPVARVLRERHGREIWCHIAGLDAGGQPCPAMACLIDDSGESLELNQGTIYPALLRLEQRGWIASEWGTSDHNRRARFYSITRSGRIQLAAETRNWSRTVAMVNRLLEGES